MKIQLISCDMSPNCTSRFNSLGIGLKGSVTFMHSKIKVSEVALLKAFNMFRASQ